MRVAVTGAGGQLGKELLSHLRAHTDWQVAGFDRTAWDLTDPLRTNKVLVESRPDVVIHCAAYTKVDECEQRPEQAFHVNSGASRMLAKECGKAGVRLVYISTDYVFNGKKRGGYTERDHPLPINVYGRSKRMGEQWVARYCPLHLILRTSWLYGRHGHNFVRTVLARAERKEPLSVVTDQVGCPTYTGHLARMIELLLRKGAVGLFHTAGGGSCSWYEFAVEILHRAGMPRKIAPITSELLNLPARRPACSILLPERLKAEGFPPLPHWKEGLEEYFDAMGERNT
jgi:dTDP-4-dehydrorhamnose reductase